MTRIRNAQRGEGRLGCFFWLLLLGIGVLIAARVVPVKIAVAQLKDHMEDLAERHARGTSDQFQRSILQRAKELDLPVEPKHIVVKKSKKRAIMDVEFVVPLDFLVMTYEYEVKIHVDRDIFII